MIRTIKLALGAVVVSVGAGCTMANVGPGAAERQTQRAVFSATYDDVYRATVQQAGEMKWAVLFAEKDAGSVRVATPQTLGAWADTVAVNVTKSDSGVVVLVRSTLGQNPNRKNVQRFLEGLSRRLSPAVPYTRP
jgi:hypothetical protein